MVKLTIHFEGEVRQTVSVPTLEAAAVEFAAHRDEFGFGASDMMRGCGDIKRGSRLIAKVSYNGRAWVMDPSGEWQPLDGVAGAQWLKQAVTHA